MTNHGDRCVRSGGGVGIEPGTGMAELRGDCARMAARWGARPTGRVGGPVPPIAGVRVDPGAVRLVAGMSEYGD
ncbi:hypothetical protein [Streptomyces sp. NBC_01497]|uniref:hypothetical protein n=1 Tax=Streptomyces sp. NBC_01497 TaxID=2903885 RepID=UPI002E370E5F|nr:hypothetical protein [Streptomyces sp. NBC_01497]